MTSQQSKYAEHHGREMASLLHMVDAIQRGDPGKATAWGRQMEAATDAKVQMLASGLSPIDADNARIVAERLFDQERPGQYQAARRFMYALKARMGR